VRRSSVRAKYKSLACNSRSRRFVVGTPSSVAGLVAVSSTLYIEGVLEAKDGRAGELESPNGLIAGVWGRELKEALRARFNAILARADVAAVFATGGCNGRAGATGGCGHNGSAIVILAGFIGGAPADGATRDGGVAILTVFEGYAFAACRPASIDMV
jgi:hypothetical protein